MKSSPASADSAISRSRARGWVSGSSATRRSLRIGASSSSAAISGHSDRGEVDAAVAEGERHPPVPHLLGQELDVRVTATERPAERRQRLEAGAPRVGDAQPPQRAGRRALGVLGRPVGVRDRPSRAREERASGVGEADLPGRALEELDAEVAFELPDRGAEGRLGHVQALRGAAEVQLLRYGDEVAQMAQLDHLLTSLTPLSRRSHSTRSASVSQDRGRALQTRSVSG
jgi:hypothetical protein